MAAPVDNQPLREAVEAFAASPDQMTYWQVMRHALVGDLLLDVTGSTPPQFAEGTGGDGGKALLAFTRQEEAQKLHPDEPAATVGQSAASALEFAAEHGYSWLSIDPAGPSCAIFVADVAFILGSARNDEVKAALTITDHAAMRAAVVDALSRGGALLLAVNQQPEGMQVRVGNDSELGQVDLAYTSSVEVVVSHPEDNWAVTTVEQVIDEALTQSANGLAINPGGPWVVLRPDELRTIKRRLPS